MTLSLTKISPILVFFVDLDSSISVNRFIENNQLPHLLFYGPPGTGKTSTILAISKMMHGDAYRQLTLEVGVFLVLMVS